MRGNESATLRRLAYLAWARVPEAVRLPANIVRRRPAWRQAGTIFIHVPKAAGVSVSVALYGRPPGHFRAVDVRRVCPRDFDRLLTFGVVRNPVERLYSAWRFVRAERTADMGVWRPERHRVPEFETFERFVCEWLAVRDAHMLDGIFVPQVDFVCDRGAVIVDRICRLETLAADMASIGEALGRPLVVPHRNRSPDGELPMLGHEARGVIERVYADELARFAYDWPS